VARVKRDVFVNCPFDQAFKSIFDAIVFAIMRSGFRARCALETNDGAENRLSKIETIIEQCRFGIHDLSRTEADGEPPLPRFNMPLELGLFLGAKRYGDATQKRKRALILDVEQYRYQRFISDIAGQDIQSHGGDAARAIEVVARWLREQSGATTIPGGRQIAEDYLNFREHTLPAILERRGLSHGELAFNDYTRIVFEYLDTRE
jgi:hypothetical protein